MADIDVDKFFRDSRRCLRPFHIPGESLIDFFVRAREGNPEKWSFWQMLCHAVKESLDAIVLGINRLSSLPRDLYTKWGKEHAARLPKQLPKTQLKKSVSEVTRWWTLVETFIPVPDSENGGCARSDSLIRSLVL